MTLRHNPRFVRFWLASTVSDFGTYVTTVALSVLILVALEGSAFDQGLINAARWLPYLLFGLVAGIWVDLFERRTVLIAGDIGRGALLVLLSVTAMLDVLTVPWLMAVIFTFGVLALLSDAAFQSFIPLIVQRAHLTKANARLQQSDTVAQTTGAAVAGGLVALVTAPVAILVDACSYFFSGAILFTMPASGTSRPALANGERGPSLRFRIAEGLHWIYGHTYLRPLILSTHGWFIGFSMAGAVIPTLVLREMGFGAFGLGLILGGAGVGAVIGTTAATRLGDRFGTGRTIIAARFAEPAGIAFMALAPVVLSALEGGTSGDRPFHSVADWTSGAWCAVAFAFVGQFMVGSAMGADGPLQMGFEQSVTPDRLLARMSATRRSVNRGMIVVGAPLGGLIATNAGVEIALLVAAAIVTAAAFILLASPFRGARTELLQLSDEEAQR